MATTLRQLLPSLREKIKDQAVNAAIELAERVYIDTPVDTGMLEESWLATINGFAAFTTTGNAGEGWNSVWPTMELGDTLHLINWQPYVRRIEYIGWSAKAPDGMMWKNIPSWGSINYSVSQAA